jgi:hypothetical protein
MGLGIASALAIGCGATAASGPESQLPSALRDQCSAALGYPGEAHDCGGARSSSGQDPSTESTAFAKSLSKTMLATRPVAHQCFEAALRKWPTLEGVVVVRFVIGSDGSIRTSEVMESTVSPKEVGCCIANGIRRLRFEPSPDGKPACVQVPYALQHETRRTVHSGAH